jgi:hypothetical protein
MELARTRRALSVASHASRKTSSIIQSTVLVLCAAVFVRIFQAFQRLFVDSLKIVVDSCPREITF